MKRAHASAATNPPSAASSLLNPIDLLTGSIFVIVLLIIGMTRSRHNQESYLFANRKISLFPLIATLVMTELNTAALLAFSSIGYLSGWKALSLPLVFLIGLTFYALVVAKKWREFDSIGTFFSQRYGPGIARIATWSLSVAMIGFSATYVKSLYLVFSPLFPNLGPWTLSGLLVAIVVMMSLRGGLQSIVATDVVSFLVIVIIMSLLFFIQPSGSLQTPLTPLPPRFIISLIVLTMFTYISAPWYSQKIYAAKSKQTAFLAALISALIVFALYGLAVAICVKVRTCASVQPDAALPHAILSLPQGLKGLAYAVLFAAAATTLAGVWSALIVPYKKSLSQARALTLLFALLSYLLANLLVDRILDKLILANIPVAALSFTLLAGFYWKRATTLGAYLSIITGLAWGTGCYLFLGNNYTWYWAIYGIPLIFLSGTLASIARPNVTTQVGRALPEAEDAIY